MGFPPKIMKFLVIMVIAALVLGCFVFNRMLSSFHDAEEDDAKDQSEFCPLLPIWGEEHISTSGIEGLINRPRKQDLRRVPTDLTFQMDILLKYLFLDGQHKVVKVSRWLDDLSVHQVSRRQEDTYPMGTYLLINDALQSHLSVMTLVLLIAHSSAFAAKVYHMTALRKYSLGSDKSNNTNGKASQLLFSSIEGIFTKDGHCKNRKKHDWFDDPLRWTGQFFVCKTYSLLERVASYRPFAFDPTPSVPSALTLAEAGFQYPGVGTTVQCEGCGKSVEIASFNSPATAATYHREGCSFATVDSYISSNQGYRSLDSATLSENENATPNALNTDNERHEISSDLLETLPASISNEQLNNLPSKEIPEIQESVSAYPEAATRQNPPVACGAGKELEFAKPLEQHTNQMAASGIDNKTETVTWEYKEINQPVAGMMYQTNETATRENEQRNNISAGMPQHTNETATRENEQRNNISAGMPQQTNETATRESEQRNQVPADSPQQTNASENMGACANPVNSEQTDPIEADAFKKLLFDPNVFDAEEQEMLADGRELMETCPKNPGHFGNFPVWQLQLEHIPSNVRCPQMLQFIKLIGKLVVKLTIKATSSKRPYYSKHKETTHRCGTGMAFVKNDSDNAGSSEPSSKWNTVRRYLPVFKRKGTIYIKTSNHLVYDDFEAENTDVEFFFDNPNCNEIVKAKGVAVCNSSIVGDATCFLKCKISDLSVVEFVRNTENELNALVRSFPQRIKECATKRVFVISHPHGLEKVFSYGEYALVKYALKMEERDGQRLPGIVKINNHTQIPKNSGNIRKMLFYTADTCKGSSGGLVISFKKTRRNGTEEDIELDLWIHTCVEKKHGLNASVLKELTPDDIANHGKTSINRPSIQDEQEAEADAASRQVVSGPVYTVIEPPVHPVYVTFMKRLGSYPTPFNHIHTATDLADAGFFFAGYADCVRCFQCGLGLRSWKPGDSIYEEHSRNRPDCQFLQMKMRANGIQRQKSQSDNRHNNSHASAQAQIVEQSERGTHKSQQPMAVTGSSEPSSVETGETQLFKATNDSVETGETQLLKATNDSISTIQNKHELTFDRNNEDDSSDVPKSAAVSILEREQKYLRQLFTCKVCFEKPVKDLFLPCGELIACLECSKLLTHCPSCNKKILATVTTFFT